MQKRRKRNEKQEKRKSIVRKDFPNFTAEALARRKSSFSSTPVKFVNFSAEALARRQSSWPTSLQKFSNFTAVIFTFLYSLVF